MFLLKKLLYLVQTIVDQHILIIEEILVFGEGPTQRSDYTIVVWAKAKHSSSFIKTKKRFFLM